MSSLRAARWLTVGIMAFCIGVWIITLYSFFLKASLFPTPNMNKVTFQNMTGIYGFDRPFVFAGDCVTLRWGFENSQQVIFDGQTVEPQGQQSFCLKGDGSPATFHVWVNGFEAVYTLRPAIFWQGRIPLPVFGVVGILASALLFGFVLRLRPFLAFADRVRDNLARHERGWTTAVTLWIVGTIFAFWLIRGSPGLVAAAERMDELRALLRTLFGGTF